jgi:hypothetical protein
MGADSNLFASIRGAKTFSIQTRMTASTLNSPGALLPSIILDGMLVLWPPCDKFVSKRRPTGDLPRAVGGSVPSRFNQLVIQMPGVLLTPGFLATRLVAANLNRHEDAMSVPIHDAILNEAVAAVSVISIGRISVAIAIAIAIASKS